MTRVGPCSDVRGSTDCVRKHSSLHLGKHKDIWSGAAIFTSPHTVRLQRL